MELFAHFIKVLLVDFLLYMSIRCHTFLIKIMSTSYIHCVNTMMFAVDITFTRIVCLSSRHIHNPQVMLKENADKYLQWNSDNIIYKYKSIYTSAKTIMKSFPKRILPRSLSLLEFPPCWWLTTTVWRTSHNVVAPPPAT